MQKLRRNRSVIGDAILPEIGTKLTKTCGSKFGGLLWRRMTLERKTATWAKTTVPLVHNSPKDIFGKFTSCATFDAHKLRFEPFWTIRILTQRLAEKKLLC